MKLKILAFGITRDIVEAKAIDLTLMGGNTVEDLRKTLYEQYPKMQELTSLMIAVNNEYSLENIVLTEQDEIALIPPVSGG